MQLINYTLFILAFAHTFHLINARSLKTNGIDLGFRDSTSEGQEVHVSGVRNQCSLCSRIGTALVPQARPLPSRPDLTCATVLTSYPESFYAGTTCEDMRDMFENQCCDQSSLPETYDCATAVRSAIVNDSYDTFVAPIHRSEGSSRRILEVDTLVTFLAVKSLDVKTSTLELFVNIDLIWNDPRLRWDMGNEKCVSSVQVRTGPSAEETEIWVPSLDLINRATSTQDFPASGALVRADGTVEWSRLGSLTAICEFSGLRRMPFDDLGCMLYFAGDDSEYSVFYKLRMMGNNRTKGYTYYNHSLSYAEYSILDEKTKTSYAEPLYANLFSIELFFKRATQHYVIFTILPNMFFTYLSFGQFALDLLSGERLAFSITVVLINVTHSMVTANLLPVCRETLWLNTFTTASMFLSFLGIMLTLILLWIVRGSHKVERTAIDKIDEEESLSLVPNASMDINRDNVTIGANQTKEETKEALRSIILDKNVSNGKQSQNSPENLFRDALSQPKKVNSIQSGQERKGWRDLNLMTLFRAKLEGRPEKIKKIDYLFLVSSLSSYSLFIIVMFATNYLW